MALNRAILATGAALALLSAAASSACSLGADREEKQERERLPPFDYSDAVVQDEDEIPPPPPFEVLFFDAQGNLLPPRDRDDRHLSPGEKAKNPLVFPKWGQFLACLARQGFPVRPAVVERPEAATYDDVVAAWEQARAEGPSSITQDAGTFDLQLTDAAANYVACHLETIGLP